MVRYFQASHLGGMKRDKMYMDDVVGIFIRIYVFKKNLINLQYIKIWSILGANFPTERRLYLSEMRIAYFNCK